MGIKTSGSFIPFSPILEIDGILKKQCSFCKLWKPTIEYYHNYRIKSGWQPWCKACVEQKKQKNKSARREYDKKRRDNNLEEFRKKERENYYKNREKLLAYQKLNGGKYNHNRDKEKRRIWLLENKERLNQSKKLRRKNRREIIKDTVSSRIRQSLRNGKHGIKLREIFNLIGYDINNLRQHLENQFLEGMSWENYGYRGWHIHHKISINKFNCQSIYDDDFKKCWALDNLQPLWMKEHFKKNGRWREE